MTMTEHSTVVGVFKDRTQAEHALHELRQAGFSDDQIGFSAGDEPEGAQKGREETGAEKLSAHAGPIVVVVRAENRQEETSDILRRNGADSVSSHEQPAREAGTDVLGREYDPILGPTLVKEEDILPTDNSGFGLTRDPALDATPAADEESIRSDKSTQEQAAQLGSADTGFWKDPNVKNPTIR